MHFILEVDETQEKAYVTKIKIYKFNIVLKYIKKQDIQLKEKWFQMISLWISYKNIKK